MSELPGPLRRLYGLQYLRAVAALSVLAFHSAGSDMRLPVRLLQHGVDLFFVLSGFLMVAITDERTDPLRFFRDRFLRVAPVYWIASAAMAVALWSGLAWTLRTTPWHLFASFAFIPALSPSPQPTGDLFPVLPPGWTLNYEMLFYLLFAGALLLPRRRQVPALTGLFAAAAAAGLLLRPDQPVLRAWTDPISLEFVAGAWTGLAWQQGRRLWPVLAVSLLALVAAWALRDCDPAFGRLAAIPPMLAMLVAVLTLERRPGGVPCWRIPRLIGDASYSIYLWQVMALIAWTVLQRRFGLPYGVVGAGCFVTGLAGGIAAWWLIERPLLAWLGRSRRYRRGVPIPGGI